jgi:hypothetical protein
MVADDDGLAPAEIEARGRSLVRHALGQSEDVDERVVFGLVREEPGAAQGRAQCRGVDRDDGAQPGLIVGTENDLLVAIAVDVLEHTHCSRSFASSPGGTRRDITGRE